MEYDSCVLIFITYTHVRKTDTHTHGLSYFAIAGNEEYFGQFRFFGHKIVASLIGRQR